MRQAKKKLRFHTQAGVLEVSLEVSKRFPRPKHRFYSQWPRRVTSDCCWQMSLADKVAALRAFFGVNPEVQLLPAVEAMHAAMGSVAEGALPAQV